MTWLKNTQNLLMRSVLPAQSNCLIARSYFAFYVFIDYASI